MNSLSAQHDLHSIDTPPVRPQPPAWVDTLVPGPASAASSVDARWGHELRVRRHDEWTLVSAELRDAPRTDAGDLADAVTAIYNAIAREVKRQQRHPVRIWNFVPDIQGAIDGAGDRYMAFNEGRYAAYCDWFGGPEAFAECVPTSSAVGIDGDVLWVHALASDCRGRHVENPRQIPAYGYSKCYGLRPPCFARATLMQSTLLIGGTASILGEHSRHNGDLERQTRETLKNLDALIAAAAPATERRPLEHLRSARVHVRAGSDGPAVRGLVEILAPGLPNVEFVQAPLCRKELLVEIEGVAAW
jgi:enamine deaminase RidA (YjgF/YER057c/UK114 family)